MKSSQEKQADFVMLLCPTVTTKSGDRYQIADWEITEPKERKGQHLSVSRSGGKPIMQIQLIEPRENNPHKVLLKQQLYPSQSGEFYLDSRLISIREESKGKIIMTGLTDQPLKMTKGKILGEK